MPELIIRSIGIDPDGLVLDYLRIPDDVRDNGVARQTSLAVPTGSDYDDEIDTLLDAARALVRDVLDDFERMPVPEPLPDDDEIDEDDDDDE